MVRIRGRIGDWPVDLTLELEAQDWAQLSATPADEVAPVATAAPRHDDALWQTSLALLRQVGQIEGPQLLEQLAGLAGGEAAGKRLLVRLRHCAQVCVESGADAPLYRWVGESQP